MLTHIDHVGIACRDLEEKISFYCATFGLTVASAKLTRNRVSARPCCWSRRPIRRRWACPICAPPGRRGRARHRPARRGGGGRRPPGARVLPLLASYIQLLEPLRPDSPVGKFLERRGEGIHHIGYGVTDVRAALAAIGASGVRLVDERPRHGSMGASIAFLHPADVGGVLTELVEHPEEHAGF